jgi:hypothetical protein
MDKSPTLCPGFRGELAKSKGLTGHLPAKGATGKALVQVAGLLPWGLDASVIKEIGLTGHSSHGSGTDIAGFLQQEAGISPTDWLVYGHWSGTTAASGAGGIASRGAAPADGSHLAAALAMPHLYQIGDNRLSDFDQQLSAGWKLVAVAFYAYNSEPSLQSLDPREGWSSARNFARQRASAGHRLVIPPEPPFEKEGDQPPPAEGNLLLAPPATYPLSLIEG